MDFLRLGKWQRFEELCRILLNLEYDNILGAVPNRGDRGIDSFSVTVNGNLQIYQFKYLKGKLTDSGRQQIKNSLKRASNENPVRWHLLTSAEFSMDDWDWWKSLGKEYSTIELKIWINDRLQALIIKHQENLKMEFTELFSTVGLAIELGKKFYENVTNDLISLQMREANIEFLNLYSELTGGDKNCWKNGHFRLEDVEAGFDARRNIVKEILTLIETTRGIIIFGRSHHGKSTILKRIALDVLDRGYVTLYTDNLSANSIVLSKILKQTLEKSNLNVLFVADNVSASNITDSFKCFNKFRNERRLKFLFASREDEFKANLSSLKSDSQREVKTGQQELTEVKLDFSENDSETFMRRSTQSWHLNISNEESKQLSKKFYELCEGDPLIFTCMIISYLNNRLDPDNIADPFEYLEYDFNEKINILDSNNQLWNVAIHCMIIGALGFRMVGEILNICNITTGQIVTLSNLGLLFKNSEYKVRHGRWAIEFLIYICKKNYDSDYTEFCSQFGIVTLIESLSLRLNIDLLLIFFTRLSTLLEEIKFRELVKNWVLLMKIPPDLQDIDKANLFSYGYGNFYLNSGDYELSIQWYDKAIGIHPNHYPAWNNKGNAYHALKQYSEAKFSYDEAIKIEPRNSEPFYNKAKVLNDEGLKFNDNTKFEEALICINSAIEYDPEYQWNYFEKGNTLVNLKRDSEGVAYYYKTLSINPRNEGAWLNIASVLIKRKIYDYVNPFLKIAEKINPRAAELWYLKGLLAKETGSADDAEKFMKKALELDPNEAMYHCQIGILLLQKSEFQNAFEYFINTQTLDNTNVFALGNLSICSISLRRKCDALVYSARTFLNLSTTEDWKTYLGTIEQLCIFVRRVSIEPVNVRMIMKIFDPDLLLIYLSTFIGDKQCTEILCELLNIQCH